MNVRTLNKFLEIYNYEICTNQMTQEGKMKLDS